MDEMICYAYTRGTTTDMQSLYIQKITANILNCSIIPDDAKDICVAIAQCMLESGYELAFVVGLLGNIVREGSVGEFENSNYNSNPKPYYLQYMDTEYNGTNYYLNNFSGKTIMDVDVLEVWNILDDLSTMTNNTFMINGRYVGFGLGCVQWSFTRAYELAGLYLNRASQVNGKTIITRDKAIEAEVSMILNELTSSEYDQIISDWRNDCSGNMNSADAAASAASMLCEEYLKPQAATEASKRAKNARNIYSELNK